MDLLPDDVLLEVLQYLDVPDLLACRRVSKRIGGLVLVGRVWRHRELLLGGRLGGPPAWPCERGPLHLLHLAPCLDHLYICGDTETLRALTKTKCAVASLTLRDSHLSFDSHQWYAEMVGHQEALGRLRHVHLKFCNITATFVYGRELLDALTTLRRLESLTCSRSMDYDYEYAFATRASSALFPRPSAQSLRKFTWFLNRNTALCVHAVLARHSSTLEDVELRLQSARRTSWTDDTVAALLATLPKLHSLRIICPNGAGANLPGLPAVAACGSLRKLSLGSLLDEDTTNVVELLRRAKQLSHVRLDVHILRCEVMEALASPALKRLKLILRGRGVFTEVQVQVLLRALPALPALRHLELVGAYTTSLTTMATLDLLRGITPATTPALRILELDLPKVPCPHAWAHEEAVRMALVANPSLNIQLYYSYLLKCKKRPCRVCALGCHTNIRQADVGIESTLRLSLSLHELQIVIGVSVL